MCKLCAYSVSLNMHFSKYNSNPKPRLPPYSADTNEKCPASCSARRPPASWAPSVAGTVHPTAAPAAAAAPAPAPAAVSAT